MKDIFVKTALVAAALIVSGCANNALPGPRLRAIQQASDLSNDDIKAARDACHLIAASDYNCSGLVPPEYGMSEEEWKSLHNKTRICRRNQMASFRHCMQGKGVHYSEFN